MGIMIWALVIALSYSSSIVAQDSNLAKPTYTVVAPKKLRPNLEYHVSVSVHEVPSPVDMTIVIAGPADGGAYNRISKTIVINPRESQIINFDIGEWGPGKYNLTVAGQGGLIFENSTNLEYEHKSLSVFVQTDKAVYKPGHLVQFRVVVVNPHLLPTVTGAIDLYVTDAKQNRIRQWKRVFTSRGIVSESLQLSDNPVLGEWSIFVNALNQTFNKTFTVAEYVLPTYEVKVELPSFATYNKSEIVATVKASYTYGKPVKGEVTLTVAPLTRYNYLTVRPYESFQVKSKIDGSADFYITLRRDLNLKTDFFEREIEFFALVEEELTGRKYNTTNTMKIFDKDIKVDLVKTSKTFKPGLKYTAFLRVAYQDDMPVNDATSRLRLLYGYTYNEDTWSDSFYDVPRNGLIVLNFYPPLNASVLTMRAQYKGQTHYIESLDPAMSPSNTFIQATMLTREPKIGQDVDFEVNSTEPIHHIVYEVMGRGDIVFAQGLQVPFQSTYRFNFPVTYRMAPRARVVVYYVKPSNGEIVADSINFDVEGVFRTPVTVDTDIKETKPGGRVTIRVKTKPNAYVGILGIDQSILLIKSGNDITQKQVVDELQSYDSGKSEKEFPPWYGRRSKRSLWWTGSVSAGEIFEDSGIVILSNGLLYKYEQMLFYRMSNERVADSGTFNEPENSYVDAVPKNLFPATGKTSIRLRSHFPETWLWNGVVAGNDGIAGITSTIPDTITSWVISAFAMDPITGLGIAPETTKVTVFRPFFIKLSLPTSVIRGESVAIQVVVFNYLNKAIQAEVTMENKNGQFKFTGTGNEVSEEDNKKVESKTKQVSVESQDGSTISFLITPIVLGNIELRVTASSSLAGDSVSKNLLVKPEGTPQYFNKAVLLDLRNPSSRILKENVTIPIPKNAINGSTRITVSAIGDLLGTSVNNLDQLLHMPFGCGEQNMLNFVPNIVIMEYLKRANRLTPVVANKARAYTESGYQRELTYKRSDGSFSAFGESDKSGSSWLTAFVLKSFAQAENYIDIDERVMEEARKWLIAKQKPDGSFEEPGEVHHKAMQSGSGSGAALTAFVLIALLENQNARGYTREINSAQRYLVDQLRSSDDPYVLAIGCYALHLADDPSKDSILNKLSGLSKKDTDVVYWSKATFVNTTDKRSDFYFLPHSNDVEMTSYVLLTHALRADVTTALPIMRWLISQLNENGGFASTQDTVIGIQALGKLAARLVSSTISVNIKLQYAEGRQKTINISGENALLLQKVQLPASARWVEFEATGYGVAVIQMSWVYNLAVSGEDPPFFLNPLLDKTSTESYLQLSICTHYKEEGGTNMAVMEVNLPSGYLADVDALPSILQIPKVKRVDAENGDTAVNIYFDKIDKEELCVTVPAHRSFKVAHQKPVPVKVYDYYNLVKSARMFYHPHEATLCDICEENDCSDKCNSVTVNSQNNDMLNGGHSIASFWFTLLLSSTLCMLLNFRPSSI